MDSKGIVGAFALHNFSQNLSLTQSLSFDLGAVSGERKFGFTQVQELSAN